MTRKPNVSQTNGKTKGKLKQIKWKNKQINLAD